MNHYTHILHMPQCTSDDSLLCIDSTQSNNYMVCLTIDSADSLNSSINNIKQRYNNIIKIVSSKLTDIDSAPPTPKHHKLFRLEFFTQQPIAPSHPKDMPDAVIAFIKFDSDMKIDNRAEPPAYYRVIIQCDTESQAFDIILSVWGEVRQWIECSQIINPTMDTLLQICPTQDEWKISRMREAIRPTILQQSLTTSSPTFAHGILTTFQHNLETLTDELDSLHCPDVLIDNLTHSILAIKQFLDNKQP